jgi:PAS domain
MPSSQSAAAARSAPIVGDVADVPAAGEPASSPIADLRLRQAHEYWRCKAAARAMPCRADIDPTEIPRLLPDVMLVDVLPEGRYRYRLIGTENTQAHGMNATGRYLDEVLPGPEYKAHVIALYDESVAVRRALYSECLFIAPQQRAPERHTKVLFMPLAEDGETVNMVFVMQIFFYIDQATRERHFIDSRPYKEIAHILL